MGREFWAELEEYPPYMVSQMGRVMNRTTGCILSFVLTNSGYLQVHLWVGGRRYPRYVHRLVVASFYDVDITTYQVNHINGDKWDNFVGNLEVSTPSQNSQHAYDTGLRRPPSMKAVRIVETGETFLSISDAARYLNRAVSTVAFAAKNNTPTAGIHLEYVEVGVDSGCNS